MSKLTTAARRIMRKEVRRPPSPVEARDAYPSMVFSLYDDAPPPSPRLLHLAVDAVQHIMAGDVNLSDIARRATTPDWFTLWPGEHYMLLASLMLTLRPRVVVEIGTFTGLSALTMKKYLPPEGRIATFDLKGWRSIENTVLADADFADGRLVQHLDDLADRNAIERHRTLLEAADFFFIDGPKDNVFEYQFIAHLRQLHITGRPILVFDDTRLWSMLRFWRLLPFPKLDLTSYGSWSGTGLAELAG